MSEERSLYGSLLYLSLSLPRPKDSCLLLPMNQQVIHECWVEAVGKDRVTLKITEKARQAAVSSRSRCSLRFVLSRIHMREMHYAVDLLEMSTVFPEPRSVPTCLWRHSVLVSSSSSGSVEAATLPSLPPSPSACSS